MRFRDRILHLAMAFLLPVVCLASMLAFTIASVRFGESDRAIIWAEGSEAQMLQLSRRVADTAQFPDGRYAGPDKIPPASRWLRARSQGVLHR